MNEIQFVGGPKDGCVYVRTEPMPRHLSVSWPLPEAPVNVQADEPLVRMHLYELCCTDRMRFVYRGVKPVKGLIDA